MSPTVTAGISALVHGTADADIPADAREAARRALLDTVGVALAGSGAECVRILREALGSDGPDPGLGPAPGGATLLGTAARASALDAALVNATAAHALDYDDTHANVRGHPSAAVAPAALALAETLGASGADLVSAYVLGLEVAARVGRGIGPSHAAQGFHSTSTLGVLGAAGACARLLGLDPPQVATALGIAASGAAGLRLNFGCMTKPLHAGNAARAGLLAARLAQRGFTAHESVLDHGGFGAVFSPGDGDPDAIAGGPDGGWQVVTPGIAVKKYPCCNRGHRAVDALLTLIDRHRFGAADVRLVEVRMPAGQVDAGGRVGPMTYPAPLTGLQAKFSMQYVLAAALLDGGLGIGAFTDEQVARPEARRLLGRVRPVADPLRPAGPPETDYVEVRVHLDDGDELAERVRFARGDPRGGVPLTAAELAAKYRDCAGTVLPAARVERSLDLLGDLDALPDVGLLTRLLGTDPGPRPGAR
jgi:2-methylcitrate dehydratase PrpD